MLEVTSLMFGVNAANAYANKRLFYAALLLYLCITSVIHHNVKHLDIPEKHTAFWSDQFAIWSVVIMTAYYFMQLPSDYMYLCTIMLLSMGAVAGYLLYGWWYKIKNPDCHMAVHFIGSMTVHCIILGSI